MDLTAFFSAAVIAGTPLLYATLGEIVTERVGNLNLGVEGMMLMGSAAGFVAGFETGNPYLALTAAAASGAFGALIYSLLTVTLRANQVVTGLALTILGGGLSSFIGQGVMGQSAPQGIKDFFMPTPLPLLGDIPLLGKILFNHDILVYLSYIAALLLWFYLYKTRTGLNLRAVGENPGAADASSVNVTLYKYLNTLTGGALCGLGGAYLSLVYVPSWQENMTAGRGWIAVALVIFASWNPLRALLGAYLFGGLDILGFRLQDPIISRYFIDMLPYIMTIIVLTVFSYKKSKGNSSPEALGTPYFREER